MIFWQNSSTEALRIGKCNRPSEAACIHTKTIVRRDCYKFESTTFIYHVALSSSIDVPCKYITYFIKGVNYKMDTLIKKGM